MQINPKKKYIDETRSLTQLSRDMNESQTVQVCDQELLVLPNVFNPSVFFSSCWFAKTISKYVHDSRAQSFLEVGSGTGLISLTVSKENENVRISACDINPDAVRNTQLNFERAGKTVETFQSDVFSNVEKRFDVIFWSMPFGYLDPAENIDVVDKQTFDPGYKAIESFFKEAKNYLNENGTVLFGFSPEIGHMELIETLVAKYGWHLNLLAEGEGEEKSSVRMRVYSAKM